MKKTDCEILMEIHVCSLGRISFILLSPTLVLSTRNPILNSRTSFGSGMLRSLRVMSVGIFILAVKARGSVGICGLHVFYSTSSTQFMFHNEMAWRLWIDLSNSKSDTLSSNRFAEKKSVNSFWHFFYVIVAILIVEVSFIKIFYVCRYFLLFPIVYVISI